MEALIGLSISIFLLCLGLFVGSSREKSHFVSLELRENKLLKIPAVTIKKVLYKKEDIKKSALVTGSAVISLDYFKRILASLKCLFGGRITAYETLLDRARREALLRMKERAAGADIILNVRIETATIGSNANNKNTIGSIEAIAYGTAVFLNKN